MDNRGVEQKTYKDIKKDISLNTAINVGFYMDVINEIPHELLLDTIKDINIRGLVNENTNNVDLANKIVTESVKRMSFQQFKGIAPYFFSFIPDDKELYQRTSIIEVTKENYDYLINNTERAFGLENKIKNFEEEKNSLENKIKSLETIVVPSEDEVIGVDLDKEELLLLMSPNSVYIDEGVIEDEYLINSYRSTDSDIKQIVDYLTERYIEIDVLYKEYILNNDTYRGLIDIDYYDIEEIDFDDIPLADFRTHLEYYEYAEQFESFNEKYNNYNEYILERFETIYLSEYTPNYSDEFLTEKRNEVDEILNTYNKYLVIQEVVGYSQGEKWDFGYLADKKQSRDVIDIYLENYVGAWYRGSLTELKTISFSEFENGEFVGKESEINYIDMDILPVNEVNRLAKIKDMYPEFKNYITKEKAISLSIKQKQEVKEPKNGKSI